MQSVSVSSIKKRKQKGAATVYDTYEILLGFLHYTTIFAKLQVFTDFLYT